MNRHAELGAHVRSVLFELAGTRMEGSESQPCRYKGGCDRVSHTYADLCDEHAVKVYQCVVKPSRIPGAGMGLFAVGSGRGAVVFDEGDTVDLYEGVRVPLEDVDLEYGFEVRENGCIVDGASTQSCVARYINHSRENANCVAKRFVPDPSTDTVLISVVTKRPVAHDEELLMDYGDIYHRALLVRK